MSAVYTRDTLECELSRLSSAPRIIPKLAALVKDPNMNPEDVIEVIRHDPALTARLIAACKSAAVHHGDEVSSVSDAVQCLGFTEVYRLAVVVAFRSGFCGRFMVYEESADLVWHRAVATACFMEEFALESDGDMSTAFTTGLLHMLGMFFVDWHCSQIPSLRISVRNAAKQLEFERKYAGFTHMEISALALDYWGFSREVYEPIRWYAEPDACPSYAEQARQLQLSIALGRDLTTSAVKSVFGARSRPSTSPKGASLEPTIAKVQKRLQIVVDFLRL